MSSPEFLVESLTTEARYFCNVIFVARNFLYSQLCCVKGEKEEERMMQNEDKARVLTIIIIISYERYAYDC